MVIINYWIPFSSPSCLVKEVRLRLREEAIIEEMAEAVVTFFLAKLGEQLSQEAHLLRGVKDEVGFMKRELESMKAFLEDADRKSWTDKTLDAWVKDVRLLVFAAEDVVDKFMVQTNMVQTNSGGIMGWLTSHACFFKDLIARHKIGSQIPKLRERIKEVDERRKRYDLQVTPRSGWRPDEPEWGPNVINPSYEEPDVVGIDSDLEKIKEWLLRGEEGDRRSVISITGMGGSGKSTLAKKLYNHVKGVFDCHAWVTVSQSYTLRNLLIDISSGFSVGSSSQTGRVGELIQTIHTFLEGKKFILVLDDIWEVKVWEELNQAFPYQGGCKIVFTTRIGDVAKPLNELYYVHHVQPLYHELAWELFCKKAFQNSNPKGVCPPELKEMGEKLVQRCEGLPLALVLIGGLMSKEGTGAAQWRDILHNLDLELIKNPNLERLNRVLLLSYSSLPFYLRQCFLYCGLFPEDYKIERWKIKLMWIAEGFVHDHHRKNKTVEEIADDYFMELIDRNMLQLLLDDWTLEVNSCKVHDLMRELAIHISEKDNFGVIWGKEHGSRVEESLRRLSIQVDEDNIPTNASKLNLRTFMVFGIPLPSLHKLFSDSQGARIESLLVSLEKLNLALLSVLDLQGAPIKSLPVSVCDMIHLRYLGLRETGIQVLPSTIGKLRRLQTLDIISTPIKRVPSSINLLHHLRHLFLADPAFLFSNWVSWPDVRAKELPLQCTNLRCLQTLDGVRATPGIVRELRNFPQLRTLFVNNVTNKLSQELCASVNKMAYLRSLTIQAAVNQKVLQFETHSSPPLNIEELRLYHMSMERLPDWVRSLNFLARLDLFYCDLIEDPLSTLQHLSNLLLLHLGDDSYKGKNMGGCGPTGFPKLRSLRLEYLLELEEMGRIEEGGMPNLQIMGIHACVKLKMLPEGIQHLPSLKELKLSRMLDTFLKRLSTGGEDQNKVQHIHRIYVGDVLLKS